MFSLSFLFNPANKIENVSFFPSTSADKIATKLSDTLTAAMDFSFSDG